MVDETQSSSDPPSEARLLSLDELRAAYASLLASLDALRGQIGHRRSATEIQELSLRLGYFALALNHHMDGNLGKAEQALARAEGRAARMPAFFSRPDAPGGGDWKDTFH